MNLIETILVDTYLSSIPPQPDTLYNKLKIVPEPEIQALKEDTQRKYQ